MDVDAVQPGIAAPGALVRAADGRPGRSRCRRNCPKALQARAKIIVEQGEKSNALFIILTGRARVITTDSRGREVILATLQPGDYIGEMSLIDNEPHSATVRTEVQTDMLMLGRDEFSRCLPENSSMSYAIMRGLVQRLRHADRKIESLALMDVYGRVARSLLEFAADDGEGNLSSATRSRAKTWPRWSAPRARWSAA
jgi:CRP-like cAMP-binding protein